MNHWFCFTEEFLLVVRRTDFIPTEENLKGPTIAEVLAATKHIPLSRTNQSTTNSNVGMLQTDVKDFEPLNLTFSCWSYIILLATARST